MEGGGRRQSRRVDPDAEGVRRGEPGGAELAADGRRGDRGGGKNGRKLPADTLKTFVLDRTNDPAARAAAFDVFKAIEPKEPYFANKHFLDDPSADLRRPAVAEQLALIEAATDSNHVGRYQKLLESARDMDQVEEIAKRLEKLQPDKPIDFASHFGYLQVWHLAGPFDSPDGSGFAKSFPAESGYDPSKRYEGKGGKDVGWKTVTATPKQPNYDPKGSPFYAYVDINTELGKTMDAVAYAASQFTIEKETPCEVRVGCQNAIQIFLNGKKLFEREAYHHGYYADQHVCAGTLKAGRNEVVLKIVQNNQKEPWAQYWAFNARVCDATGGKLPIRTYVPPMPTPKEEKK